MDRQNVPVCDFPLQDAGFGCMDFWILKNNPKSDVICIPIIPEDQEFQVTLNFGTVSPRLAWVIRLIFKKGSD